MTEQKLVIEFTKKEKGCLLKIEGSKNIDWARYFIETQDTIIKQLKENYEGNETLEESKERLLESIAEMAGKSVDEIKKELSKMKGSEKENITKLALETALNYMKKDK